MVVFEIFGDSNVAKSWKAVALEQERLKGSVLRQTTTLVSLKDSLRTVAQTTRFIIVRLILTGRPSDFCNHPTDRHDLHKIRRRGRKIPISKLVREPGKIGQTAWQIWSDMTKIGSTNVHVNGA